MIFRGSGFAHLHLVGPRFSWRWPLPGHRLADRAHGSRPYSPAIS
jgi:hypothetical protein